MRALRRLEQSLSSRCERLIVAGLCRVRGVRWAIRYLRNPDPKATGPLLRHFGAQVGPGTTFKRTLWLDNVYEDQDAAGDFSHLQLGANCYVGDGVYLDLANQVVIRDNVVVSGHVSFLTHSDCNRSKELSRLFPRKCAPVEIGSDVWLGFGATILGGVKIGDRSVVAAGAVVTESLPGGAVYAGTPARQVRALGADATPGPGNQNRA